MIARSTLPRLVLPCMALAILPACSTAQLPSPATIAAIGNSARCVGSFLDLYDVAAQIRAILAEHQRQASLPGIVDN